MTAFRLSIAVALAALAGYTLLTGLDHGWNFLPNAVANVTTLTWSGQFNLDFLTYLALSGLWVTWRHKFTAAGFALGVSAALGGMLVLAPYLLWASVKAGGDTRILLLGKERASFVKPA